MSWSNGFIRNLSSICLLKSDSISTQQHLYLWHWANVITTVSFTQEFFFTIFYTNLLFLSISRPFFVDLIKSCLTFHNRKCHITTQKHLTANESERPVPLTQQTDHRPKLLQTDADVFQHNWTKSAIFVC